MQGCGLTEHVLEAKECAISVIPRPPYCDRGKWEAHVLDHGYPTNPNPVDSSDMFPRLYFDFERCRLEMEAWMNEREYTPCQVGE
jgi:hypothetical protein